MADNAVSFTDHQIEMIKNAVAMVPVDRRSHFIKSLANRLCADAGRPGDKALQQSILFTLAAYGVSASRESLFQQPKRKLAS